MRLRVGGGTTHWSSVCLHVGATDTHTLDRGAPAHGADRPGTRLRMEAVGRHDWNPPLERGASLSPHAPAPLHIPTVSPHNLENEGPLVAAKDRGNIT